jgi:hypothetical protein
MPKNEPIDDVPKKDDYTAPGNDAVHFLLEFIAVFFLIFVVAYGSFWFALVAAALVCIVVGIMCYDVKKYLDAAANGEQ